MSWPICSPQSPRCTSLVTCQPLARNRRCRESPIMDERRWPTCIGLATFGPPKSITSLRPEPLSGAPSRASPAIARMRPSSAASATSRLMKPGPAISTLAKSGSAFSRLAIFSAIARGLALACLAAASAPLHWNWARSGRSEACTEPSSGANPSASNAQPAMADNSAASGIMGRSDRSPGCSSTAPWSAEGLQGCCNRRSSCPWRPTRQRSRQNR